MSRECLQLSTCLGFAALLFGASQASAQVGVPPDLAAAAPFAVLGTNSVPVIGTVTCTDTGPGIGITGQVGTTFAGGITNTGCTISGPIVAPVPGGVVAAFNSALSAIDTQNPVCTGAIPIVSTVLPPGVYCSAAGTTIPAGVTLTLSGNASDVWIFRVGTGGPGALTLTGATVNMGGSALSCNVFWKTSAAATLTDSTFNGTLLSGAAVTMTRTNWTGRAMATTNVTLTDPVPMTFAGCSAPATITVNKDFVPNDPASVPIALSCTSGTVTTAPANFSEAAAAVFRVGGALAGATCTATETVPAGYTANQANCASVALNGTCTIVNTLGPPGGCPAITIPGALSNAQLGVAYSQTLTATGGVGPYTFSVVLGTLPVGLTLTPAGVLSGTPTVAVPQTFTIRATDSNGCFVERSFTIFVVTGTPPLAGCPVITLEPATLPNGAVGVAYSQTITAVGGIAPFTFTRTAGDLPPSGLTLASSGMISGTPTASVFNTFTIRGTDANGCFAELSYQISILAGVPTMPQAFAIVMFLGLLLIGYAQLRKRARLSA